MNDFHQPLILRNIVVPRALIPSVNWAYVFEKEAENLSDHVPVAVSIKLSVLKRSIDQDADLPSYGRRHISWQKYSMQQISNLCTSQLSAALKDFICCDDLDTCFQQLSDIIWKVSESNMKVKSFSNSVRKDSRSKFQLPDNINLLKKELSTCHQLWKSNGSDTCNQIFEDYKELRSQYRNSLRHFVISQENEKIKTLCKALC